jgi:hypothetical protein
MCGYSLAAFDNETDITRIQNVCRAHTHVLPPQELTKVDDRTRSEMMTVLQHRSRVLDRLLQSHADRNATPHPPLSTIYLIDDR